jgi:hypothetical protein
LHVLPRKSSRLGHRKRQRCDPSGPPQAVYPRESSRVRSEQFVRFLPGVTRLTEKKAVARLAIVVKDRAGKTSDVARPFESMRVPVGDESGAFPSRQNNARRIEPGPNGAPADAVDEGRLVGVDVLRG